VVLYITEVKILSTYKWKHLEDLPWQIQYTRMCSLVSGRWRRKWWPWLVAQPAIVLRYADSRKVLSLFSAPQGAAGVTTSGGSESILMACLSARQKAYRERGITEPEM